MTKTVAFESPAFTTALAQVQTPLGVVKVLVRYIVICIKVLACVVVLKKKCTICVIVRLSVCDLNVYGGKLCRWFIYMSQTNGKHCLSAFGQANAVGGIFAQLLNIPPSHR